MKKDDNYTGYATLSKDGKTLEAVSSFDSIGMYQPCLYVENGTAICLKLGGLPNAGGTPIDKKVQVYLQTTPEEPGLPTSSENIHHHA